METVTVAGLVPEAGMTDSQFPVLTADAVNGTAEPPTPAIWSDCWTAPEPLGKLRLTDPGLTVTVETGVTVSVTGMVCGRGTPLGGLSGVTRIESV
jgi:hypothetical protein